MFEELLKKLQFYYFEKAQQQLMEIYLHSATKYLLDWRQIVL